MRAGLVVLLLAATVACGGAEFTTAAGDAGGGGGTNDATTPSDGTAPPGDSGPATGDSGAIDSAVSEASDAGDASDAAQAKMDGGEAGPPVFTTCAATAADTTVLFCSDFDLEEGTSGAPWNWTPPALATSKAMNADDTTHFVSPPNGYAATSQALGATDSANFATVAQPITTAKKHVTYAFDVYVGELSLVGSFPIAQIIVGAQGAANRLFINLVLAASGLTLQQQDTGADGGTTTQTDMLSGTLGAKWTHVEIDLDRTLAPALGNLSVLLDGALAGSASAMTPATTASLQVGLGILIVVPPSTANAVTFDNAIVHAHD